VSYWRAIRFHLSAVLAALGLGFLILVLIGDAPPWALLGFGWTPLATLWQWDRDDWQDR
jgi:hypothetical protein